MKRTVSVIIAVLLVLQGLSLFAPVVGASKNSGMAAENALPRKTLKKVEVLNQPLHIVEGSMGLTRDDVDSPEYFDYILPMDCSCKYTFSDGSIEYGDYLYLNDNYGIDVGYSAFMSYENQWHAGEEHEFELEFYDEVSGESIFSICKVVIDESPVKSITPLSEEYEITEYTNGMYFDITDDCGDSTGERWYCYTDYYDLMSYRVEYKDGNIFEGNVNELYEQLGEQILLYDGQEESAPWGIGKHYVKSVFLGCVCTVCINIVESPVKNVVIAEPVIAYSGVDCGYYEWSYYDTDDEEYHTYREYYGDIDPRYVEVYFNDGTVFKGDPSDLEYGYSTDVYEDFSHAYDVGDHTAIFEYLGFHKEYTVRVKENPIAGVKIIKGLEKTEFRRGETIVAEGAVIGIRHTDGEVLEIELNDDFTYYGSMEYYDEKIDRMLVIENSSEYFDEKTLVIKGIVAGFNFELARINIVDYNPDSVEISNGEDGRLYLKLSENGVTEEYRVTDIMTFGGYYITQTPTYNVACEYGYIMTDRGEFYAEIYYKSYFDGSRDASFCDISVKLFEVESNVLESCPWLEVFLRFGYAADAASCFRMTNASIGSFNGKVTSENIETLMAVSLVTANDLTGYDVFVYETEDGIFCELPRDQMEKLMRKTFVINDDEQIDFDMAKHYTSHKTDNVVIPIPYDVSFVFDEAPEIIKKDGFMTGSVIAKALGVKDYSLVIEASYGSDYRIRSLDIKPSVSFIDIVLGEGFCKEYTVGDEFDFSGISVFAAYSDRTTEIIPVKPEMVKGFDTSKPGEITFEISYEGKTAEITVTVVEDETVTGDVTGDGDIDMKDLLSLVKYLAGVLSEDDINDAAADVNGDGDYDMKDVLLLKMIISGCDIGA